MKTRSLQGFGFGLALAVLPFVAGCNQAPGGASHISTNAAVVPPAAADDDTNQSSTGAPEMVLTPPAAKTVPANIKPSAPLSEVIRLAQAGVEENVILAFVNSSQGAFSLGSEEIIYLTDIGVDDDVVTAMIERDRTLKLAWAAPSETVSSTGVSNEAPPEDQEVPVATSPTYENAPEPYPVEEPPQVVSDDYFYDNLSPYGSWVYVDDYGWCWQPTVVVVNHNWQPYCDRGRWVYTDCGWYWQSDYSWGLTFHYGRWFNHPRHGWCWWPDRTWSPSWVTWRYNDSYCGWAPLPPRCHYRPGFGLAYHNGSVGVGFNFGLSANCYTFVSWRGFCDSRPYRHRLSSAHVTTVINNTTVVNNMASGDHNRIVNRGIAPERVTEAAKQPIRRVAVRDAEKRTAANRSWDRNNPDWRRSAGGRSDVAATGSQPNKGPAGASGSSERRERPKVATDNDSARGDVNYGRDRRPSSHQDRTPTVTSDSQNVADRGEEARRGLSRGIPPSARNDNPTTAAAADSAQTGRPRNHGSDPASVSASDNDRTASATKMRQPPSRSLIVIGKRDENQSRASDVAGHPPQYNPGNSMPGRDTSQERRGHLSVSHSGEEIIASAPQAEIQRPVVARNWSPPAQIQHQQDSRSNQRFENRSDNRPSPSVVVNRQPPPVPSTFVPAAPRPDPQQVAATPPAPRPQPAQSPPTAKSESPHPSPPANSGHSGGRDRGSDDGGGRRR